MSSSVQEASVAGAQLEASALALSPRAAGLPIGATTTVAIPDMTAVPASELQRFLQLEAECIRLRGVVSAMTSERENLKGRYEEVERIRQEQNHVVAMCKATNNDLKARIAELEIQNKAFRETIEALRAEINALREEGKKQDTRIAVLETRVGSLQADVGSLQAAVGALRAEFSRDRSRIDELETGLGALKAERSRDESVRMAADLVDFFILELAFRYVNRDPTETKELATSVNRDPTEKKELETSVVAAEIKTAMRSYCMTYAVIQKFKPAPEQAKSAWRDLQSKYSFAIPLEDFVEAWRVGQARIWRDEEEELAYYDWPGDAEEVLAYYDSLAAAGERPPAAKAIDAMLAMLKEG